MTWLCSKPAESHQAANVWLAWKLNGCAEMAKLINGMLCRNVMLAVWNDHLKDVEAQSSLLMANHLYGPSSSGWRSGNGWRRNDGCVEISRNVSEINSRESCFSGNRIYVRERTYIMAERKNMCSSNPSKMWEEMWNGRMSCRRSCLCYKRNIYQVCQHGLSMAEMAGSCVAAANVCREAEKIILKLRPMFISYISLPCCRKQVAKCTKPHLWRSYIFCEKERKWENGVAERKHVSYNYVSAV